MKVSGFTFLRNAQVLGYPFTQSIRSILPIVDEYIIALGPSEDETEGMVKNIGDPKIKIVHTQWNENMSIKGFVYGQQKSIALFNCTGDWAFYLEADEVIHEDSLPRIKSSMERHLHNNRVESLVFDYIHFYGNKNTYAWSPHWYRYAPRIIKNNICCWAPDGLFFIIVKSKKKGRYPYAALADATVYHYGWIRSQEQMNLKSQLVGKYWEKNYKHVKEIDYSEIDGSILREFKGSHPAVMRDWLPEAEGTFKANPNHRLTKKERKHRIMFALEKAFRLELSKKHYKLIK